MTSTTRRTISPQAAAYRAYVAAHPDAITPQEVRDQINELRPQLQILIDRASYPDGFHPVHRHLREALSHLLAARDASHLVDNIPTATEEN